MVGSQLLNNLSGSGIPADHPNGTTEPRKKNSYFPLNPACFNRDPYMYIHT